MEVNGVAVMRRRHDGWLNATQILKVAGVDKGKRTKVLEKEILIGEHEKVQGGYGKYQGTWINYHRGREFCRQYGVEQLLIPLLEYDLGSDGGAGIGQHTETPTKEQAMAAQRKRMYGGDGRAMSQSAAGTYFKSMSNTAANAIQALNRTRMDSPSHMDGRRPLGPRRPSQPPFSQESMYPSGSQQSMQSMTSQDSFSNGGMMSQGASFADFPNADSQEPPRKRIRPSPQNSFLTPYDGQMDMSMQQGSPTEPSQSFFSQNMSFAIPLMATSYGLEPLPHPQSDIEKQRREYLLDLFMDPSRTDFDDHPAFLKLSGDEFEIPIDATCNTALHWAATLARIGLVKKLLERGFNIRRANSGGETALIAACQARNNLDQSSFPQLLDLLGPSIEVRDRRGRTLLHHIAVSSAMKGRAPVGRYYLESLLEFVVRQGSIAQATSLDGLNGNGQNHSSPMTLARFMTEIVNAQDKSGDTALNLAARTSTTSIIDQLLEVGADPNIPNRGGLAPVDFGVMTDTSNAVRDPNFGLFDVTMQANGSGQRSFEEAEESFMSCE
jgi:regulatory protein SWI6